MKTKEKDVVYGRKQITLKRGGNAHKLFQEGIVCYMAVAMNGFEIPRKGSIFDPDIDMKVCEGSIEGLEDVWLDKTYSELSKLRDLIDVAFNICYIDGDNSGMGLKLSRWCHQYNAVAKEFARVHKTKVKVFGSLRLRCLRPILKLSGKQIANCAKRKPSKKTLETFKDLKNTYTFRSILAVSGIRQPKKGDAK